MSNPGPFLHWQQAARPHDRGDQTPLQPVGDLPPGFRFTQNNLQDMVDCPRRFQLRYVLEQRWPALEAAPAIEHEKQIDQGTAFHQLVESTLRGVPVDRIRPADAELRAWWDAFLNHNPLPGLPSRWQQPEVQLSALVGRHRIAARFDLLAADPGQQAVIVDWKTARRRPDRAALAARLQTRIYPFVLAEAARSVLGAPLAAEQIRLVYWFTAEPERPEEFVYSAVMHEANRAYLTELIEQIAAKRGDIWPLTADAEHCRYCVYRSLCDRGTAAGELESAAPSDADWEFDFDLDELDEVIF